MLKLQQIVMCVLLMKASNLYQELWKQWVFRLAKLQLISRGGKMITILISKSFIVAFKLQKNAGSTLVPLTSDIIELCSYFIEYNSNSFYNKTVYQNTNSTTDFITFPMLCTYNFYVRGLTRAHII